MKVPILLALLFGFFVATIASIIIYAKHKPVKVAKNANNYLNRNSVDITERHDRFVNHTLTKSKI